jgi:hypothetical protein
MRNWDLIIQQLRPIVEHKDVGFFNNKVVKKNKTLN